jgi:hypothetical protein
MITEKQLQNLKNFEKGKYTEAQRKGTEKANQKKRELKEIREWAEQNLFRDVGQNKTPLYEMLFKKLEQLSSQGNIKAIEMLLNYSGLKPIDKVEQTGTVQVQKVFITQKDEEEVDNLINNYIKNE